MSIIISIAVILQKKSNFKYAMFKNFTNALWILKNHFLFDYLCWIRKNNLTDPILRETFDGNY